MNHKGLVLQIACSVICLLLLASCGSPRGDIEGNIVGAGTEEPLQRANIILCLLPEDESNFLCTLQAAPTAVSDSSGTFTISNVPVGNYVLMYGLPGELVFSADEWEGVRVTKAEPCMRNMHNAVCQSSEDPEGVFWKEGGTLIGDAIFKLGSPDEEPESTVVSTGGGAYTFQGAVRSDHTGISIMIVKGELAPVVHVKAGETTDIEWQVTGR